jgi:centromere/kinetochore protein ZW10
MSSPSAQDKLGQVLVNFSANGAFPDEEDVSAAFVTNSILPTALEFLSTAKLELEVGWPSKSSALHPANLKLHLQTEIRHISQESAADVDSWIQHAKSIQDEIEQSRKLANAIVRQAEADERRLDNLAEKETYVDFLTKEVSFNAQLLAALKSIQVVNECLNRAEDEASQHKIIPALRSLEGALAINEAGDRTNDTRCLQTDVRYPSRKDVSSRKTFGQ